MSSEPNDQTTDAVKLNKHIQPIDWDEMTHPEDYVAWDNDLVAAANVALALGKPLLLTGEPGVGKSEFARWLAYELELGDCKKFVVKSTTEASDLFYSYDTLGRFHEAQILQLQRTKPVVEETTQALYSVETTELRLKHLTYQALGIAILNSIGQEAAWRLGLLDSRLANLISVEAHRSVVLIDEIDKAPRDVPNDILDEIDKMTFAIKEIGNVQVHADKKFRPVVIITSNSERDLPEPFLRRCVYYHIPFPNQDRDLQKILLSRLRHRMAETSPLLSDAMKMLAFLRSGSIQFMHKPGLAELLDWLYELTRDANNITQSLTELPIDTVYASAKTTLLKHAEDQKKASKENWKNWMDKALQSNVKP